MSLIIVKIGIKRTVGPLYCSEHRNGNGIIAAVFLLSLLKLS